MQFAHLASPIKRLWASARAMFGRMHAALGDAASIAAQRVLERDALQRMRDWLRPLEALVRQTLFIEAGALARANALRPPLTSNTRKLAKFKAPPPQPQQRTRAYALRLWPRPERAPARIRMLGPAVLVREIWRENDSRALANRLRMGRFTCMREPERIARRIDALARILRAPLNAIRRLARKLRVTPHLALKLAARRTPKSPYADTEALSLAAELAFHEGRALNSS